MPGWLVALVADVSILLVIAAVCALYCRLAPAESVRRSVGISLACASAGALAWFLCVSFVRLPSFADLTVPLGLLGGLAALLASLTPRGLGLGLREALVFSLAWGLLVYVPVALGIFVTGVGGVMPIDHGGSLAVNVAAGAAALGVLLVPRSPAPVSGAARLPRGLGVAAAIALVVGWIGWLVAAELVIGPVSGDVIVNGLVAAAGGTVGWLAVQRIRHQTTTLGAVAAGLISGLVAVTAGAPLMSPVAAASSGVVAGALACIVTLRRVEASRRQQWFLVGSHLIAASTGLVLLGLLADGSGFVFTGRVALIQDQALSTLAVAGYSGVVALLLWLLLRRFAAARA